ncbi:MAG: hypothetical protein LH473_08410 [Chitinophagales bacterium]|nr:hypothetical protein [Chitinophagales bacterium]
MSKEEIIKKTAEKIGLLTENRLIELADFTDFLLRKQEEEMIQKGIQHLMETSGTYDFLNEDPVVYTLEDCKERYR